MAFVFGSLRRITDLRGVVESAKIYYLTWGGRIVPQVLLQTSILIGKPVFNFVNSIAFVALVVLAYLNANGRRPMRLSLLAAIPVAIWFALPSFGQSVLWLTGAVSYLWPAVWMMGLLLPYRLYLEGDLRVTHKRTTAAVVMALAFASSCSNENIAPTLLILLGVYLVLFHREGMAIPGWSIAGLVGTAVGSLVLFASPGTMARLREVGPAAPPLLSRFLTVTHTVFLYPLFLILSVSLVMSIAWLDDSSKRARLSRNLVVVYGAAALAATYAMTASPQFPPRAWMGIMIFAIVAAGVAYSELDFDDSRVMLASTAAVTCAIVAFAVSFAYVYVSDIVVVDRETRATVAYIESERAAGRLDVSIRQIQPRTPYSARYDMWGLGSVPQDDQGQILARYYGIRSLAVSSEP